MLPFYLKTSLLLFFVSCQAGAISSISDGELVISLRNDAPCFSYPADDATQKRNYVFASLEMSWSDKVSSLPGVAAWYIGVNPSEYGLANPSSPATCIGYGDHYPGALENKGPAKPIRYDVPYRAHMRIASQRPLEEYFERKYESWFCLSRDATGATVLLKAERNRATSKYECVPPEKIDKRGFFDRLFNGAL
mgnify:CR=1 FL=1